MARSPDHPILLGHRGARASRDVPENTLASFDLCLEHDCDGFEFDVRLSLDGVAVICHDPAIHGRKLERKRIDRTPAHQLALPTLDEVLKQFSGRAFLDIELKVPGLETSLLAALDEYPPSQGYVVSSFLPEVLKDVHRLNPAVPLGYLYDQSPSRILDVPVAWMIPHLSLVTGKLIDDVHSMDRKVMVWTVNRSSDIRRLAPWGVDAIISDDTRLLADSFR